VRLRHLRFSREPYSEYREAAREPGSDGFTATDATLALHTHGPARVAYTARLNPNTREIADRYNIVTEKRSYGGR
jgi:hypothetical protein